MPIVGWRCRCCAARWPLAAVDERCLAHFADAHEDKEYRLMPAVLWTLTQSALADNADPRRNGEHLSASMAGGCMREYALQRTLDRWADPLASWQMSQGTWLHASVAAPPGWTKEVSLPPVEILPGLVVDGQVDLLKNDLSALEDIKTTSAPNGSKKWVEDPERPGKKKYGGYEYYRDVFPPSEESVLQVSIYVRILMARGLERVPECWIQKVQLGVKDPLLAMKGRFRVTPLAPDVLDSRIRKDFEMFQRVMRIGDKRERLKAIGEMPLTGLNMYVDKLGGNKCTNYCEVATAGKTGIEESCGGLMPEMDRF